MADHSQDCILARNSFNNASRWEQQKETDLLAADGLRAQNEAFEKYWTAVQTRREAADKMERAHIACPADPLYNEVVR